MNAIKKYVVVTQNRLNFTYHGFYRSIRGKKELFWRIVYEKCDKKTEEKR